MFTSQDTLFSLFSGLCKTSFTIYICNQGVLKPKEKESMLNMSQGEHGPQQELAWSKLFLCAWAGGCALIELSTDLSGLLTPSLQKNNDSSRKSHCMCKITVRSCSMLSKHKHQVSKAIYIADTPLFISRSNCFFFNLTEGGDAHQKLPLGNYCLP